jgi:hypothetical protein
MYCAAAPQLPPPPGRECNVRASTGLAHLYQLGARGLTSPDGPLLPACQAAPHRRSAPAAPHPLLVATALLAAIAVGAAAHTRTGPPT